LIGIKRTIRGVFALSLILILSCGDTGVSPNEEPTNEDAIYNIIRFDRPSEFNIDLYNLAVPETAFAQAGPIVPSYYWYNIERDSLFIAIDIRYVEPNDPPGTNPTAEVRETKYFWGTLEIIGLDTSGGGAVPVRLSKEFTIVSQILAVFEKYGFDYNFRRGWILTELSDAVFNSGYLPHVGQINIHSESGYDYIVDTGRKPLADIFRFAPGDSLTISLTAGSGGDYVNISYRAANGYSTIQVDCDSAGIFSTGFRLPESLGYDHFLVDVIYEGSLTDTLNFTSGAIGVVYRTR